MRLYPRTLKSKVQQKLFRGKALIIFGPRQVGKTTLIKSLLEELQHPHVTYLNCDLPDVRASLEHRNALDLKALIGKATIAFIDEAQRVENIGLTIKALVELLPDTQVIATGSSSFELANKIREPLTGRKFSFHLLPLSLTEILPPQASPLTLSSILNQLLVFGSYPEVTRQVSLTDKKDLVRELAGDNLYRDVLNFGRVKNPRLLRDLLKALALQIGSQVSYSELSRTLGVDKNTVETYVDILEKSFLVFRLSPLTRNLRTELRKSRKVFFYDLGIRNALINNFNDLSTRMDVGPLWENYCILERIKSQYYYGIHANNYFWRTYDKAEIDWIEERGGKFFAYELKWNPKKSAKPPKSWLSAYPNSSWQLVSPNNVLSFLADK